MQREVPTIHPHRAPPGRGGPALPRSPAAGGGLAVLESATQGTDGYPFIFVYIY